MRMKRLIEIMRRDTLISPSRPVSELDPHQEYELLHIPTLLSSFKSEAENGVNSEYGTINEDENCANCIQNYLLNLDRAVRAAKGLLISKK